MSLTLVCMLMFRYIHGYMLTSLIARPDSITLDAADLDRTESMQPVRNLELVQSLT